MLLHSVILENFRAYRRRTEIEIEPDLTAFIGRNDVGKSTIFDALAIFFDNPLVKIDHTDVSVDSTSPTVTITCKFKVSDDPIILDSTAKTTLQCEQLLNRHKQLEIIKRYDTSKKTIKPSIFVRAKHPTLDGRPLICLKQENLRAAIEANSKIIEQKLGTLPSRQKNPEMRRALREAGLVEMPDDEIEVPLDDKSDIRWEQIRSHLPLYALFRADRPSTDEDAEVQDPLKFAIQQILQDPSNQKLMDELKESVRASAIKVAERTLEKLEEINAGLARELQVDFRAEPRWDSLFKLTVKGDDGIPLNKRGSGVRRLMILSFFRAEAERRRIEENKQNCIYAIEEPETSQHPSVQKLLIEALQELADTEHTQVLITTHVPGLAAYLKRNSIRHITRNSEGIPTVRDAKDSKNGDEILQIVAEDLGISPDPRCRVIVYVEGGTDVDHLTALFAIACTFDRTLRNPLNEGAVLLPLGGVDNILHFLQKEHGKRLGVPDLYIVDGDARAKFANVDERKKRVLRKHEIEFYIPRRAIEDFLKSEGWYTSDMDKLDFSDSEFLDKIHQLLPQPGKPKKGHFKKVLAQKVWQFARPEDIPEEDFNEIREIMQWILANIQ